MTTKHPLTLTVEQAAQVLGIGRSTAYELVRTGDLKCIHLRRRIVIPVAHLADCLGVSHADVLETAMGTGWTGQQHPQRHGCPGSGRLTPPVAPARLPRIWRGDSVTETGPAVGGLRGAGP